MGRIAIFTDDPGWHGARLREVFANRGFSGSYVSLTECRVFIESSSHPIMIPGFEDSLPDGVFVRGVPGGSLEQVVHYLNILHILKRLGIPVYNDGRAIERSVDKSMASFLLQNAGIPTPPTWVTPSIEEARYIAEREIKAGHQVVTKPVFGSQGEGLKRLVAFEDVALLGCKDGIYYLQRFIDCGGNVSYDWRVFVIAGRSCAAMRRCGSTWLNNVAQGARCEPAILDGQMRHLYNPVMRHP